MTFRNDAGEELNFAGAFAITKRAVSFFNSKIQGDVSINFNVDNNSENRRTLRYDGPQMLNQVAFTRQSFTLMRNGNPYMKGFIVIQSENGPTLSCFFMGGNANWFNLLTGLITELDYSGVTNGVSYETQLSAAVIATKYHTTEGVVFPLIDWKYNFNKGNDSYRAGQDLVDVKGDPLQSVLDYYPCFYLHTLVSEIVKQNGLKIAGTLLDDQIYKRLILPPVNGQIKRADVKITTAYGTNFSTSSAALVIYDQFTDGSDPDQLFANDRYTANRNAKVIVTITVVNSVIPAGTILQIQNTVNGVVQNPTITKTTAVSNYSASAAITVMAGDVIAVYVRNTGAAGTVQCTLNVKFDVPTQITADDFLTPDLFLPKLSCLDIIKFLVNYFGCACSFDEHSKTITLNSIEKIKVEDAQDWSQYYQSHGSQYTIDAAQNNYQRLAESPAPRIAAYNKKNKVGYGEGNLTTANTLKTELDIMSIPFSASDIDFCKNQIWQASVPIIKLQDAGEPILYQSITNDGGFNGYNYTFDFDFVSFLLVRIVDDIQGDIGIYPMAQGSAPGIAIGLGLLYAGATGTGKLYLQEIVYQSIPPSILINKPETAVSDFAKDSVDLAGDYQSFAHFVKPTTGLNIDRYRVGAALDNPEGDFVDPTINQLYFPKINRMIGNPVIPAVFKLPESIFQSFDFQRFIYLKTKDLTGYFWVDSIINYQDGQTDVQVNLLMP